MILLGFTHFCQAVSGLTPLVWSKVTEYGALRVRESNGTETDTAGSLTIASSFEAALTILIDWGINISLKRIERLTYKFGQIGINLRQSKLDELSRGELKYGNILQGQRFVIAVDGGRDKIRVNKTDLKNEKTNRYGFNGIWIEPKLLTIYNVVYLNYLND